MRVAVELIGKLNDDIQALKAHISQVDGLKLMALKRSLPRTSPAGSAEMLALILIYREMEARKSAGRLP